MSYRDQVRTSVAHADLGVVECASEIQAVIGVLWALHLYVGLCKTAYKKVVILIFIGKGRKALFALSSFLSFIF